MFKGKDLQKIINTTHFLLVIICVILDLVCVCCKIKQNETVNVTRNHTSQFTRRDDHKNERIYVKLPMRSMNWSDIIFKKCMYELVRWGSGSRGSPTDVQPRCQHFPLEEPGLPGETAGSRSGPLSVQGEAGSSWVKKPRKSSRLMGTRQWSQRLPCRVSPSPNLR